MKLSTVLLLLTLQTSEPRLPVTIRCEIDTDLPITEIQVSLQEKRELNETPEAREKGGIVTLSDLPSGDLHLLFFRGPSLLGKVEVPSTEEGEYIRIAVRLVEGNAILLDDFRVRGVSEMTSANEAFGPPQAKSDSSTVAKREREPEAVELHPPKASSKPRSPPSPPGHCPSPGEPLTLRGRMRRLIDNDSFEMQSGPWTYVVYVGTATRIHRGRTNLELADITDNQTLTVQGSVAAGPDGECSIGARDIAIRP
jgi:hypothetical protein